jgi:polysaccharide chain length determinant protein (PEP-CTERM system associated)
MAEPTTQAQGVRELQRLAEAPLRRPWLVIVPFVLVHLAALGVSLVLPPRYTSSTLILIAPDQMPNNLVPQMSTERISQRLQTLRQEVHSRTRLEMIARELDPYGTLGKEPLIDTIERMREDVTVAVKGQDAFSVSFEHRDPKMAMLVADRLTTLFMDEVAGARERQVSTAYNFLERELQDARLQLEAKEKALAAFKESHMGQLPEQVQANLATLQRLQMEQQMVADNLRKAQDAVVLLETTGSVGASSTPTPPDSLETMRALLAQLKTRYTDNHPDVKSLQMRIEALEHVRAAAEPGQPSVDPQLTMQRRRQAEARLEVEQLKARLADVDRRIAAFQGRVEAAPRREQEVLGLMRDYQKLSENYSRLLSKKFDAEMASRLEQQQKGQQFRVLDPAYLPSRPSFPDRFLFGLAGAVGGLLLGLGLAVTVDFLDPTMKDADSVSAAFQIPVLAVVPYVKRAEQERLASLPIDSASASMGRRRGLLAFRQGDKRSAARPR